MSGLKPLPKLMIIGAQKAGTTTLFELLDKSIGFCGSNSKEVGYFTKMHFYQKGLDWYSSQFREAPDDHIRFEATPEYLYYPYVPERLHAFNPDLKLVAIFREPAQRCFSAWNMFRRFNKGHAVQIYEKYTQYADEEIRSVIRGLLFAETFPSFRESVSREIEMIHEPGALLEPSFVRRGLYACQVKRYLEIFPRSQFLFLESRELTDWQTLALKVSRFVGVDATRMITGDNVAANAGTYEEVTHEEIETMKSLRTLYANHNDELFDLIERKFDWNN